MVGWPGLAVGIWMEDDRNYTTSLTCTNTPHSRGARKQAHLHRGEGSVLDSLLISGRLHCQPSQQRGRSTIEGQPHTRLHNRPDPPLLAATDSPGMVAPAEEIRGHRRHGERSAPSREVAFSHKSPCPSTQRGRPTPEHDARANHLASPARADVQRQRLFSGRLGVPHVCDYTTNREILDFACRWVGGTNSPTPPLRAVN